MSDTRNSAEPPPRTVNTAGGDYAEGNIDKRQGTFIGGDQVNQTIETLLQSGQINVGPHAQIGVINHATYITYLGPAQPNDPETRRALEMAYRSEVRLRYIEWMTRYAPLPIRTTGKPRDITPTAPLEQEALLFEIYLRHRTAPEAVATEQATLTDLRQALGRYGDLLLLGPPGGGKTTALWKVALDLACDGLTNPDTPLPIFVRLGGLREGQTLDDVLRNALEWAALPTLQELDFPLASHRMLAPLLPDLLRTGRLVLLWDGLNETPRTFFAHTAKALAAFRRTYPGMLTGSRTQHIVTCRADDYDLLLSECNNTDPLPLAHATVEALDPTTVRQIILRRLGAEQGTALLAALDETAHRALADLARTPLLLTMVCAVYARLKTLPTNRGQLLADFVTIRFAWEKDRHPDSWIDAQRQTTALANLAFAVTESRGRGTSVERAWAEQQMRVQGRNMTCSQVIALARQADLLETLEGGNELRFTHQLVQEYFAALALRDKLLSANTLRQRGMLTGWVGKVQLERYAAPGRRTGWEETLLLLAGIDGDGSLAQELIRAFLGDPVRAARVAIASNRALSVELHQEIVAPLQRILRDTNQPQKQRIEAGSYLSTLHYGSLPVTEREWIGELKRRNEQFGTPNGYFCYIPTGTYAIGGWKDGEPPVPTPLPAYWIARFPITVAQYTPFVAEGYGSDAERWWTPNGWAWKQRSKRTQPWGWNDPNYTAPNQPVIGVTWYEAMAYCAWLSKRLRDVVPVGYDLCLPTEAEWEVAAAYESAGQRRTYPWGEVAPTVEHAVYDEWKLNAAAPVGCCARGIAACGALDLVGNVWEWCSSSFKQYPLGSGRAEKDFTMNDYAAPLRGTSFYDSRTSVRCAARYGGRPHLVINLHRGFRVVVSPRLAHMS